MNSVIGSPDPLGRAVTLVATCILVATLSVPIHGSAWASCPRSVRPSLDRSGERIGEGPELQLRSLDRLAHGA
jgi:hypothetical protein